MSDTPPVEDKAIRDEDNYRKVSEPFESTDAARQAIDGFWEEFYALRNKYRIRDVYVIVHFSVKTDTGEGDVCTSMSAGSSAHRETMTAWAFAREQAQRESNLKDVMSHARAVAAEELQGEPK